jgi:hypothetical protein
MWLGTTRLIRYLLHHSHTQYCTAPIHVHATHAIVVRVQGEIIGSIIIRTH